LSEDKELTELLSELNDPLPETQKPKPKKPKKGSGIEVSAGIEKTVAVLPRNEISAEDIEPEALANNLKKLLARYKDVAEEVLDNCRTDRQQAQDVIDHFFGVIGNGGKIPSIYIEKFPDLLRTKNEIGATAVRLLGELTRLVSASKNSDILGKVNVNIDIAQLTQMLDDDDE
jgi:hypothetical protein